MTNTAQQNRGTIFIEDVSIIDVTEFSGDQFILRLNAPKCAARATAGSFAHIQCDKTIPMRRPLSIMRADADEGWIEVLFKIVGDGLRALGNRKVGDKINVIGPIGHGFAPSTERPKTLLIGGGVGIPPMVFLAETLHKDKHDWQALVIMGSEIPFPFASIESKIPTPWLADDINRTMPLLENWNVPTRLASLQGYEGCFDGYVTDLARTWLDKMDSKEHQHIEIFSCGPTSMLKAVSQMAHRYGLACQVSLEEYMACAVGGCAGCTVLVETDQGPSMKRVCVDGPVFEAASVFPPA